MSSQDAEPTRLPDHDDRAAIAGHNGQFDQTVFGDAGAGTGKTTALVDRVVNLVCSGVEVTSIAAITFTEAGAGELRHRVRTALERRRHTLSMTHVGVSGASRIELTRVDAALATVDDAEFTTLHGFAHRILADHPLQAGVSPRFAVMDGLATAAQFDRRFDAWLADLGSRPELRPMLQEMHLLGVTVRRLRRLASAMVDDEPRIPRALARAPHAWEPPAPDLDELIAGLDRLDEIVASCTVPGDKLLARLHVVVGIGGHLRDWQAQDGTDRDTLYLLLDKFGEALKLGNCGSAASWAAFDSPTAVRHEVKAVVGAPAAAVLAGSAHAVLTELSAWAAWFVEDWRRHRWSSSTLAFQDLLTGARALLRADPRVRAAVAARHRHIMVDEFQDTDPVQVDLAFLLAATSVDAAPPPAWDDTAIEPGGLCFVGDPKQSIYRFRGADIAVYEGVKEHVVALPHGRLHHLTHNFRSVPGVLDWVNTVFDELLVARHLAQPSYRALTAHRAPVPDAGSAVRWFGGNDADVRAQDQRQLQAADVARVVHELVGSQPVADGDTVRPARHDDIAVIVRRHATARQVERAFEDADIAWVVQAASLVYGTQEVRDLRTILTALDDPQDDIAVVGALRHPALGCTDVDLATWSAARGAWSIPDQPADVAAPDGIDGSHPVAAALARLAALRADRTVRSVAGYVEHVIDELGLMELALADGRPRDRWRRLRFVADRAHQWHEGGGTMRGFLRWLRDQDEQDVTTREQVVVDPDDDAVRVTTIHAAKGLEYPIVVLLGTDMDATRGLRDPALLWDDDGRPSVNIGSTLKTRGYDRLLRGDEDLVGAREHHAFEERRLAYVGATRARDLLVVSLHHSSPKSLAAELHERFGDRDDLWTQQATPAAAPRRPDLWRVWMDDDAPLDDFAMFTTRHVEAAARARTPSTVAATTITGLAAAPGATPGTASTAEAETQPATHTQPTDDTEPATDTTQAWRRGRGGSAMGRAVHAVLEVIDLATLDDLDALAATQAAAEGLPSSDGPRIAERVRRAAAAPVVRVALRGRTWRELYVGAPVPVDPDDPDGRHVTVEGFIDMLADVDGRLTVVDWKTDSVGTRTPAQIAEQYHPQAATYAAAVEQVTGRRVDRCVFVLTGVDDPDGREVEVAGADLTAARAALRATLASVASA